jgi:hypothetical protein
MKARFISDALTPMTPNELVAAMAVGYEGALRTTPSVVCLALLVAQACLETANGKKIHCWNLGNVKASPTWEGAYTLYECDERFPIDTAQAYLFKPAPRSDGSGRPSAWLKSRNADGTWTVGFAPDHAQCRFRAFESAEEGCAEFVDFLASNERYRRAWTAAYRGRGPDFVLELGRAKYFTADVATYTKAVVSIAARVRPACEKALGLPGLDLTDADREHVASLVALTLAADVRDDDQDDDLEPERLT